MQTNNSLLRKMDTDGLVGNLPEAARRKTVNQIKAARGEDPLMGGLDKFRAVHMEPSDGKEEEDEEKEKDDDVEGTKADDGSGQGERKQKTFIQFGTQFYVQTTLKHNSRLGRVYAHVFHPDSFFLNLWHITGICGIGEDDERERQERRGVRSEATKRCEYPGEELRGAARSEATRALGNATYYGNSLRSSLSLISSSLTPF